MYQIEKDNTMLSFDSNPLNPLSESLTMKPQNKKKRLADDFSPCAYSVLCGRGSKCTKSTGNQNLKRLVLNYLKPYSEATNKVEKTSIVSAIIRSVKEQAPNGAFIKYEDGAWWEVDDAFAREKIGCLFRDCLFTQYRSSTKAKLARKKVMTRDTMTMSSSSSTDHKDCHRLTTTTRQNNYQLQLMSLCRHQSLSVGTGVPINQPSITLQSQQQQQQQQQQQHQEAPLDPSFLGYNFEQRTSFTTNFATNFGDEKCDPISSVNNTMTCNDNNIIIEPQQYIQSSQPQGAVNMMPLLSINESIKSAASTATTTTTTTTNAPSSSLSSSSSLLLPGKSHLFYNEPHMSKIGRTIRDDFLQSCMPASINLITTQHTSHTIGNGGGMEMGGSLNGSLLREACNIVEDVSGILTSSSSSSLINHHHSDDYDFPDDISDIFE